MSSHSKLRDQSSVSAHKLLTGVRVAYWAALVCIAALASVSYIKLDRMMSEYQRDRMLLESGNTQMVLSQRIVMLANQTSTEANRDRRLRLADGLRSTIDQFERGHKTFSVRTGDYRDLLGNTISQNAGITAYSLANRLDEYAADLVETGRIVADEQNTSTQTPADISHLALNSAQQTLSSYRRLTEMLGQIINEKISAAHEQQRYLFLATLAFTAMFALLVFGPIANILTRKTRELIEANDKLAYDIAHDPLTGLHNRAFLDDHFHTIISGARRRNERVAVLQIDLDLFKEINDELGHAAGDFVLEQTAERMQESCRGSDLCVRMGGDEFLVILNGISDTNDINIVAGRIMKSINQPLDFEGVTLEVHGSGGIAVFPVDAQDTNDLMVHADLALYNAKKAGGRGYRFFSDELRKELEDRKRVEEDLTEAITNGSFEPYFQPQLSLVERKITGVEALIRWKHPRRGTIAPSGFLPIAEKTGQIVEIGRILMDKAIHQAAQWHREGIDFGRLSLNVSDTELREPDFVRFVLSALEKSSLPNELLSLEVIETVILDDQKSGVGDKLAELRMTGIQIELDDFGTGYASLSHINRQEIDSLKIDRRFIAGIDSNEDNEKIVRAISQLAKGLGLSIVAEGAETEGELNSLLEIGCDQVQGFSLAFPMPAQEACEWLQRNGKSGNIDQVGEADVKRAS